jgi:hypothetical protein
MYLMAVANGASNGVSIAWLEDMGYTNEFDQAALADPDSDGFENWQEYHADTIPTNGTHYPMIGMASNQLFFASSTNCDYTVEWCTNLLGGAEASPPGQTASAPPAWQTYTNLTGTGSEMLLPATSTNTTRFFRLQIERRQSP